MQMACPRPQQIQSSGLKRTRVCSRFSRICVARLPEDAAHALLTDASGQTLITEGMFGRAFQITHKGEIVREYVNPYLLPWFGTDAMSHYTDRIVPVPYEWVPEGTLRNEAGIIPPAFGEFRVP